MVDFTLEKDHVSIFVGIYSEFFNRILICLYIYDYAKSITIFIYLETPILGSRLPIRRETMKTALEHHFEHVEERKQSKMQTLGASNPHNNNKDKHRQNAKITADTVGEIFNVGPGIYIYIVFILSNGIKIFWRK